MIMKTEKQKMLACEWFNAFDEELANERLYAKKILQELNDSSVNDGNIRRQKIQSLMPNCGPNIWIQSPFYCDYGYNIELGDNVFFNFNCTVLDIAKVKIGDRVLIGPNTQIYTVMHPINHIERSFGLECGKPIVIGDDVWIGGGVIIFPGVKIGDRTVIGAGSVVTKDMPSDVVAAGNPCRVIRENKH